MTRPLKIALLGYRSHPHVGGQGIYIRHLSRALSQLGHQVDVYSGPPYPEIDAPAHLIKVPSLNLYEVEKPFRALRPKHLLSQTDLYEWWSKVSGSFGEPYVFGQRAYKLLAQQDYDIIHDNQSLAWGLVKLTQKNHKVVSTIHHPIHMDLQLALEAENDWFMRLLKRRWYGFLSMQEKVAEKIGHVITVSETSKRDIIKFFALDPNRITVIHNGVDTARFRPLDHICQVPYRIITTASSDQPLKGLAHLLEAIATLRHDFPKIHLDIIGKPKNTTEKKIKELGLTNNISFSSGLSELALIEKYSSASVAVCPSLYEGFGLPLAEAMACGVPTIASDGGAQKEVAGTAAITYPAGKTERLVAALGKLLADPKQQRVIGLTGRKHIESNFSWHKVALELTSFYRQFV